MEQQPQAMPVMEENKSTTSKKDKVLRILIVVGVLYVTLLAIIIVYFSMASAALSGQHVSFWNNNSTNSDNSMLMSYPVSY